MAQGFRWVLAGFPGLTEYVSKGLTGDQFRGTKGATREPQGGQR